MSKRIIVSLIALSVGIMIGCSKERVASPHSGSGGFSGGSGEIWLEAAPDWHSVVVFLRGDPDAGMDYRLFRSEDDSLEYRDVSWSRLNFNTWDDATVSEGKTYYYKMLIFKNGSRVGCTAATSITYRSPESVIRDLGESYAKQDLDLFVGCLAEDFEFDGLLRDGERSTIGRTAEVEIHRRMFNAWTYRTGLKTLTLSIGRVRIKRTTDEEDHLKILCFEAEAQVYIRADFDRRITDRKPLVYSGKEMFRIRHSKTDPTKWVIYKWWDPRQLQSTQKRSSSPRSHTVRMAPGNGVLQTGSLWMVRACCS